MKMYIKSIPVEDQRKALDFYTRVLGFSVKHDIPMGEFSWLTLTSPEEPDGTELALEPNQHPAMKVFQAAMMADGIPFTAFRVDDLQAEVDRLEALDVVFTQGPKKAGPAATAVFKDGCGNLIQLIELDDM